MPLTYDDIPGSWRTYSEEWPSLWFPRSSDAAKCFISCSKARLIPYGSYVQVENEIRFENENYKNLIEIFMDLHKEKTYEELVEYFKETGRW